MSKLRKARMPPSRLMLGSLAQTPRRISRQSSQRLLKVRGTYAGDEVQRSGRAAHLAGRSGVAVQGAGRTVPGVACDGEGYLRCYRSLRPGDDAGGDRELTVDRVLLRTMIRRIIILIYPLQNRHFYHQAGNAVG